mmetsp:Transcript_104162/g.318940  ORF Transcript_104162/g.318940 Transcript_104162/m.318940 type:complete len:80 (-) Transcript_104162:7-246(-)
MDAAPAPLKFMWRKKLVGLASPEQFPHFPHCPFAGLIPLRTPLNPRADAFNPGGGQSRVLIGHSSEAPWDVAPGVWMVK